MPPRHLHAVALPAAALNPNVKTFGKALVRRQRGQLKINRTFGMSFPRRARRGLVGGWRGRSRVGLARALLRRGARVVVGWAEEERRMTSGGSGRLG